MNQTIRGSGWLRSGKRSGSDQIRPPRQRTGDNSLWDSDGLRVGQKVLAIGNPFGLERTLTTGIVSALGRPVKTDGGLVIQEMIQTDSSINPGNSGGPLLNSRGQMIGVNTMIYSPSGGSVGIGFAVPVNTARRIVPDLIEYGFVKRGWIDVVPVQLFPSLVRYANLPVREGLLVSRVINGGNAQSAGIRGGQRNRAVRSRGSVIYLGGDIIVGVNGMSIATLADLYSALESSIPGEKAIIEVVRGNDRLQLTLTLSERPEQYQWE
jgi:S1-C subfamily serine protease